MAVYKTSDAVGAREDLSDVITRIDADETPIVSNATKEVTRAVNHEWQVQELAAASDTNSASEGADFSFVNPTATTRLGNQHQIAVQAASVSGTLDSIDRAGRDKETAYVKLIKGLEQRRDIDKSLFKNEAKSASDPRKAGKFLSFITNFVKEGATTTPSGDGTDVSDMAGANAALTLAKIESAMKLSFDDGGQPEMMVCSPANKVAFSDLSSGSAVTNQLHMTAGNPQDAVIIGSVSIFLTDFGTLNVVIDRQATDTEILLLDPDYYSIGHMPGRWFSATDVAATGDGTKFSLISEYTLIMRGPKAHAAVVDLST